MDWLIMIFTTTIAFFIVVFVEYAKEQKQRKNMINNIISKYKINNGTLIERVGIEDDKNDFVSDIVIISSKGIYYQYEDGEPVYLHKKDIKYYEKEGEERYVPVTEGDIDVHGSFGNPEATSGSGSIKTRLVRDGEVITYIYYTKKNSNKKHVIAMDDSEVYKTLKLKMPEKDYKKRRR